MAKFVCPVCGDIDRPYFYTAGTTHFNGEPWDNIEDHFICTRCGAEVEIVTTEEYGDGDFDDLPF